MRIGFDATALPHQPVGAGNYILEMARCLADLPVEEEVVVFAFQSGYEIIDRPERPGFHWVVLPDRPPISRLIWEQTVFPQLIRREGIHLLHSPHYTRPFALPCASVVSFHDMTFFLFPHLHTRSKRIFFPAAIRASARRADLLIASSENTRQDAIRLLEIDPERIVMVPLGVGDEYHPIQDTARRASVRERYSLPKHFILYVGLIEPRKNVTLLLDAYHDLLERTETPTLVLVGRKGWGYDEVAEKVQQLDLAKHVHFTGYVSAEDLPIVYNLADIFVYPSLYEGFGLPPLEAMACGVPVITTAVSSMPEHAEGAALLVPPGDGKALAEAMQRVLEDGALREEMSRKGPVQAEKFSWKQTAQKTIQVYKSVLQSHPRNH